MPAPYYKKEFKGYGDFLGTGTISTHYRKYRSFEEARYYARSLKLKNIIQWQTHCKSKEFPNDIPTIPKRTYKSKFKGFHDFLGTNFVHHSYRKYRPFKDARKYAHSLKLNTIKGWVMHSKSKNFPLDIRKNPSGYVKEFIDMDDFLGIETMYKNRQYRSFKEVKKYVQSLNIKSQIDWHKFAKTEKKPKDIPFSVRATYIKEWKGWGDFLGTGRIANQLKKYRSFEKARKYARSLNLKGQKEWTQYVKSKDFPLDIRKSPPRYKKEWKGWGDFLGTGNVYTKNFISYKKAKKYASSLKLKSREEWKQHTKSLKFPKGIPKGPKTTYGKEFEGWGIFLGTGLKQGQTYKSKFKKS